MKYGQLKSQFEFVLNNRVSPAEHTDAYIMRGLSRIQRDLTTMPFLLKINVTVVGSQPDAYVVKPNDYLRMKSILIDGKPILKVGTDRFFKLKGSIHCPEYYTDLSDRFLITDSPGEGTEIVLMYYAEMTIPATDDDTNEAFTTMPDMIMYAALVEAATDLDMEDTMLLRWEARYQELRNQIQEQIDTDAEEGMMTVEAPFSDY